MALKDHSLKAGEKGKTLLESILLDLAKLEETDLTQVRHAVDERLQIDIASLNLGDEIGLQYRQGKTLLNTVNSDSTIPANQKAQIFNAVRSQLAEIIAMQEVVWNMERLKKFEVAFVKASAVLPDDAKAVFYAIYGQYLKESSDQAD